MTHTQYLIAWSVYICSAVGCLLVWWRITRPLKAHFASWLRLIATILILTPGLVSTQEDLLSPALLTIIYELLNKTQMLVMLNGSILGVTLMVALLLKLLHLRLWPTIDHSQGKKNRKDSAQPDSA